MKRTFSTLTILLISLYAIFPNNKTVVDEDIPAAVSQWIDNELSKAKLKTLMDFDAGEFFNSDSARIIGYIKGYDSNAGFSTGIVHARNDITLEEYPVVVTIHEDGRFEGAIPMSYPKILSVRFNDDFWVDFYIQPGQTLSIILDLEDYGNKQYKGATAGINNELRKTSWRRIPFAFIDWEGKSPEEFRVFYDECLSEYSANFKQLFDEGKDLEVAGKLGTENTDSFKLLLETRKFSKNTSAILINIYQVAYATQLLRYDMNSEDVLQFPIEYYDFLQKFPINNRELLSTPEFHFFSNYLEFSQPLRKTAKAYEIQPEKDLEQYLFEELNIKKTPEDEEFLIIKDSLNAKLKDSDITEESKQKLNEVWQNAVEKFIERNNQNFEEYIKKYIDVTRRKIELEQWRIRDSIYTNELKLERGILYDILKIRTLDFLLGRIFKNNKEEAWNFLSALTSDISEPFLRKEADRLFLKNFPEERKEASYELPDTYEAKIFKDLIAPFKGKYVFVDFWATTCGPCIANIKEQKTLREKHKDSRDIAFVFITPENQSPQSAYNNFVKEQNLTNTYRINSDQYRYMQQLFRFSGIPRYVLVDREGKILDNNFGRYSFEQKISEILSEKF